MTKKEAYELFRKFILGKRIDRKASEKFLDGLSKPALSDLPKLCYDFAVDRNCGNGLIFSFALVHLYTTEGNAVSMLAWYQSDKVFKNYAVAYDENGYMKFTLPEKCILSGYTGPYIGATQTTLFDEVRRGQPVYLIDPYGEHGKVQFLDVDVYDKLLFQPFGKKNG